MGKNVFITGIGSGLGKALAKLYLDKGYTVYALSRHLPEELKTKNMKFKKCDLSVLENVKCCVRELLNGVKEIEIAILNAGILGDIKDMYETSLKELEEVMDVNVWANKLILDSFIDLKINVKQIVAISSGAAVNCNRGWSGYSISKAALNCLIKLYSREMEKTHLTALAPGLVLTPMLLYILENVDENKFPSVKRLKASPKRTPEEAAKLLYETFPKLFEYESGSFLDVRKM